ncbi:MAG: efflux RND transporter permease subunit [bacterium]|nr:efflux RND transporter permease subunit [bacterium]
MTSLIDLCLQRRRAILALLALLIGLGIHVYVTIPKEAAPDVKAPFISVRISHEGISAEDAERLLVRPLEQELRNIEDLKEISARAFEGGASIMLEFPAGFDSRKALNDVREKVDQVKPDLPPESDEPDVREINISHFPVLIIHLSGDVPERALYRLGRNLRDAIESRAPSVLSAKLVGDREEVLEIRVRPDILETYGLEPLSVLNHVRQNNRLIPAGAMEHKQGRIPLKVPGVIETAQDLLEFPLISEGEKVVKIKDIGTVHRTFKDATGISRQNGKKSIAIQVSKRTGENILDTVSKVRTITKELRQSWPQNVQVTFAQDESDRIHTMLSDLQNNLLFATFLVVAVIVLSLGWRSSFLVAVAVPGSFFAGLVFLQTLDVTLNIVVLFSLILSVGMLVDGAIIVVEHADRRMVEGDTPLQAYSKASKRMAWPVSSSIATTLVAFLPLLSWPGLVGQFMRFMPLTLIAVLTASLFMALIFVPTLGSLFGTTGKSVSLKGLDTIRACEAGNLKDIKGWTGRYVEFLQKILNTPFLIIGSTVALLFAILFFYKILGRGTEFFPDIEPNAVSFEVVARGNLSLTERNSLVFQVERHILDQKNFRSVSTNTDTGQGSGKSLGPPKADDVVGIITGEFTPWEDRSQTADEILDSLIPQFAAIPGIKVNIRKKKPGPPADKPVFLQITSTDGDILPQGIKHLEQFLTEHSTTYALEDNLPVPGIEWRVHIDRAQASKFDTNVSSIGLLLQFVTRGVQIHTYRPDDAVEEIDIIARFPEKDRTLDRLQNLMLPTAMGHVPLSSFSEIKPYPQTGTLLKTNGLRSFWIKADVKKDFPVDQVYEDLEIWLEENPLPEGISMALKGDEENKTESAAFLKNSFVTVLALITLILVIQFNSFFSAFIVLSSIIFSTIGVFLGVLITGQTFGIVMGGLSIVALAGIIVSNNILLIDSFDLWRAKIESPTKAILLAAAERIRPVLLTQVTTSLGLLPMAFGLTLNFFEGTMSIGAPSAQWWTQLASSLIFGIIFASVLTLIVTPSMLMARERFRSYWSAR